MLKRVMGCVIFFGLLISAFSLQASTYDVYQGGEGEKFELTTLNDQTIDRFHLTFSYDGDPKLIVVTGINVDLDGDENFRKNLYAVEDNRVAINGLGKKKIKGITVHYDVAKQAMTTSPSALMITSSFEVEGKPLGTKGADTLAIFKPITLSVVSGRIYEGSSRSYYLKGLAGLPKDKDLYIEFVIDKDSDLYVLEVKDAEGLIDVSMKNNKAMLTTGNKWPDTLQVTLMSRDNNSENGIRKYVIEHNIIPQGMKKIDDPDYPKIDGIYTAFVHDDEHSRVCLSKVNMTGSCFDLHIGGMSIYSEGGGLETEPLVRLISRSKISRTVEGEFEALYYTIPELADDEQTSDNPFKSPGATYKLSGTLKRRLGNSFSAVLSTGARVAPSQYHRLRDVSPFVSIGVEYEAEFKVGRGIVGLARVKDHFWNYNEVDTSVTPELVTERDFSQRARLYASLALNDSGSIMLSTHMDIGYGKRRDVDGKPIRSPSEVGIALTYGGKWEEIFSKLGQ